MRAAWAAPRAALQPLRQRAPLLRTLAGASPLHTWRGSSQQPQGRLGYAACGEQQHLCGFRGLHTTPTAWLEASKRGSAAAGGEVATSEQQLQRDDDRQQAQQQQERQREHQERRQPTRTVVEQIKQLGKKGQWQEVLRLTAEVSRQGTLDVTPDVLLAALQALGHCGRRQETMQVLQQLEGQQPGPASTYAYAQVINAHAKCGDWRGAITTLERMWERGVAPNEHTLGMAIKACVAEGRVEEARRLVRACREANVTPNIVTYNTLIDLHAKQGDVPAVLGCMQQARADGIELDATSYFSALTACGKAKPAAWEAALGMWSARAAAGVTPHTRMWNRLLDALARGQQLELMMEQLGAMRAAGSAPDPITYGVVINGCVLAGDPQRAQAQFDAALRDGVRPSESMWNTLINAYAKAGDAAGAERVFAAVPAKRVSVVTINTVLTAHATAGDPESARRVFDTLPRKHRSAVTYGALVNAYAKAGDAAGAARAFAEVPPALRTIATYASVVKAHCVAGDLRGARAWVGSMRAGGIEPNVRVFRMLTSAAHAAGDAAMVDDLFEDALASRAVAPFSATWHSALRGRPNAEHALVVEVQRLNAAMALAAVRWALGCVVGRAAAGKRCGPLAIVTGTGMTDDGAPVRDGVIRLLRGHGLVCEVPEDNQGVVVVPTPSSARLPGPPL